jgi:hypothetical protein
VLFQRGGVVCGVFGARRRIEAIRPPLKSNAYE